MTPRDGNPRWCVVRIVLDRGGECALFEEIAKCASFVASAGDERPGSVGQRGVLSTCEGDGSFDDFERIDRQRPGSVWLVVDVDLAEIDLNDDTFVVGAI